MKIPSEEAFRRIDPDRKSLRKFEFNNYKILDVPRNWPRSSWTQAVVVALEGLGHDPLRAVGALLLELPAVSNRVLARRSTCSFRLPPPLRMHARISSRSLNGEDTSRTSSARRCSSTRTNSRGLASPKQPGAAAR